MHSIWLPMPLPAIEIILLARFVCKTPAEKLLDYSNRFKQSRTLGRPVLHTTALCSSKNTFLLYSSTRVTRRNTLLNNSDDQCFVSETWFHCQYHCISLCVQVLCKTEETIRMQILAYFVSLFYHFNEF